MNLSDLDKLIASEGDDDYQAILEIHIRILQKLGNPPDFGILTAVERNIVFICQIDVQVCNGGFLQYFHNKGVHIDDALQALRDVRLDDIEKIFLKSLSIFQDESDYRNGEKREMILNDISEDGLKVISASTEAYYGTFYFDRFMDYIKQNIEDIHV